MPYLYPPLGRTWDTYGIHGIELDLHEVQPYYSQFPSFSDMRHKLLQRGDLWEHAQNK